MSLPTLYLHRKMPEKSEPVSRRRRSMIARVALLVSILIGLTTTWVGLRSTPTEVALAKNNNAELAATVEALQTQVVEQDARIAKLEEDVATLLSTSTSSNSDAEGTPKAR